MTKTHPIQREAQRLAAGRRSRMFRVEVRGAGLDKLDDLTSLASQKGIDASGLMSLLLLAGHRLVSAQLDTLPDMEGPKA